MPVTDLPPAEQLPAAPLVLAAYAFIWVAVLVYVGLLWRRLGAVQKDLDALKHTAAALTGMTAGHFIFIPAVLLVGVVIGWILGSRAAKDAYAAELRKRERPRT